VLFGPLFRVRGRDAADDFAVMLCCRTLSCSRCRRGAERPAGCCVVGETELADSSRFDDALGSVPIGAGLVEQILGAALVVLDRDQRAAATDTFVVVARLVVREPESGQGAQESARGGADARPGHSGSAAKAKRARKDTTGDDRADAAARPAPARHAAERKKEIRS